MSPTVTSQYVIEVSGITSDSEPLFLPLYSSLLLDSYSADLLEFQLPWLLEILNPDPKEL